MNDARLIKALSTLPGVCSMLFAASFVDSSAWAGEPCLPSWDTSSGNPGFASGPVYALYPYDDGTGLSLYAGGSFLNVGGVAASCIARWDGAQWSPVGAGLNDQVWSLCAFDDGSGMALYAGGVFFINDDGDWCISIAKWNGSEWIRVGDGMESFDKFASSYVEAMAVFDDGTGPKLYAGGLFHTADGMQVNHIAKWDGKNWTGVGGGVGPDFLEGVGTMTVFDDGNGPALYVGGSFETAGGVTVNRLGKWDGKSWHDIGAGLSGANAYVRAFHVFDDGTGPALYVGGSFTTIGGIPASRIAKWDGSTWSQVGDGISFSSVSSLTTYDDGSGPALYASGNFTLAGGNPANLIARWDGTSWSNLADGLAGDFGPGSLPNAYALSVYDNGQGPALYAGGRFLEADGETANYIAAWRGCFESACPSDFVTSRTFQPPGDGMVDAADLAYLLGEWGRNPGSLADIVDSATFQPPPDGLVDAADLAFLLGAWGDCQ